MLDQELSSVLGHYFVGGASVSPKSTQRSHKTDSNFGGGGTSQCVPWTC